MLPRRVQLGPRVLRLILPAGLTLLALALLVTTERLEAYSRSPYPLLPAPRFSPSIAPSVTLPTEASALLDRARVPVQFTLLRGETVSEVFAKLGLGAAEAQDATAALAAHVNMRALRAGNRYSAFFNPDASLASFELTLAGSGRVAMSRQGEAWSTSWQAFRRTTEVRALSGRLEGALDGSIRAAGGPPELAYRMADILQWDLDFTRDLRAGDRFEVVYDETRVEGEFDSIGTVYALAYEARGRRVEAYRYGDQGGYYDGEGRPLKKMFLRSPLRYSHITSRFSHRRFHPVLKQYRPHYGVDYGAPVGTPVRAVADGVVELAGWNGGYGISVTLRHGRGYSTMYNHLSSALVKRGQRVQQREVVGRVGSTGLSTGPHLDYRVMRQGRFVNPLDEKFLPGAPVARERLEAFQAHRDQLLRQLHPSAS
jgi:murein DD-endopeptidase MepM/ murein hydrolase activator NlpD